MIQIDKSTYTRAKVDTFWIGKELCALGKITKEQLDAAIEVHKIRARDSFAQTLISQALTTQKTIADITAKQYNLPVIELNSAPPHIAKKISHTRAKNLIVVPYREDGQNIHVAVEDPGRYPPNEARRDFSGRKVHLAVAPRDDILACIDAAWSPALPASNPGERLNEIIHVAIRARASDIHFEPKPEALHVRFRIDGDLIHQYFWGRESKEPMINAIKLLGAMDTSITRKPQDGRAQFTMGSKSYNLRMSTLPTEYGEKAVIRLQDENRDFASLPEFGVEEQQIKIFREILQFPNGVIFTTGPTGSGKTTLQYALLGAMPLQDRNVTTIEEPVEYRIPAYTQCSVDENIGRSAADLLRALLRQDPDIILVGETRDREMASIVMQAALTGHLVFSTLHTNDAASSITRLIDLGIEPFLVAGAVKAVCATRLVRKLCLHCSRKEEGARLETFTKAYGHGDYKASVGCEKCNNTGFNGRTAIIEVFKLSGDQVAERMILEKKSANELLAHFKAKGYSTMLDDGIQKAKRGITTLDAVFAQIQN